MIASQSKLNYLQLLRVYKKIINIIENYCLKPFLHLLENECYAELKEFMTSKIIDFQLTPTGRHRRNLT